MAKHTCVLDPYKWLTVRSVSFLAMYAGKSVGKKHYVKKFVNVGSLYIKMYVGRNMYEQKIVKRK